MSALTVQNFASAAAGIAIAIAVTRGFARQQMNSLGNFWVDLTRATVYILLPLSLLAALVLCSQGVIQNLHPYTVAKTLEGAKQIIAQGPVAGQEAIKMLGTNGGGFFNANSAHPFENPTPFTNLLQMVLIFIIPAGLTYTFGAMVGDRRQGWAIFSACSVMFLVGAFRLLLGGTKRQSRLRQTRCRNACHRTPNRRQYGGQGNPLRHRRQRLVRHHHHRRQLRRRQWHAR